MEYKRNIKKFVGEYLKNVSYESTIETLEEIIKFERHIKSRETSRGSALEKLWTLEERVARAAFRVAETCIKNGESAEQN